MGKEERSTGGGGDGLNELESLLEELIAMEEDGEQRATDENTTRQNNIEADKEKAMEVRKRAMESIGETRERMGENDKGKKKRRSSSDGMYALEKAIQRKQQIDQEEREARAEERHQQLGMQEAFLQQLKASRNSNKLFSLKYLNSNWLAPYSNNSNNSSNMYSSLQPCNNHGPNDVTTAEGKQN